MLNHIWAAFFVLAILSGGYQFIVLGQADVFELMVNSTFDMAKLSVEISIGLVGVLSLWLGFFRIAEKSNLVLVLSRCLTPLFSRLIPGIPKDHPALGSITMNMAANMLGLDNAATPMGLKAMKDLQEVNENKQTASNAQILFLVLNTSSVTLLPVTIFMYRAQLGASEPADVFLPILLATTASTLAGLMAVAWVQKLPLFNAVVLAYIGGFVALMTAFVLGLSSLDSDQLSRYSQLAASGVLLGIIGTFLVAGLIKKLPVYELFVEGAKEGFETGVRLIPYLVAMLVAIGVFRASGAMDVLLSGVGYLVTLIGLNTLFVDALPVAFMKPLSGSGARAMMLEVMNHHGVDSFQGRLASIMQGSTETTFYVLAVYFGSVGITRIRHALVCGLIADSAGIIAAIGICYWFFG